MVQELVSPILIYRKKFYHDTRNLIQIDSAIIKQTFRNKVLPWLSVSSEDQDIKYDWLYQIAYIIYHIYDLCDSVALPVCNTLEMIVRDEVSVFISINLLMHFYSVLVEQNFNFHKIRFRMFTFTLNLQNIVQVASI